jgi:hypothetical protein
MLAIIMMSDKGGRVEQVRDMKYTQNFSKEASRDHKG